MRKALQAFMSERSPQEREMYAQNHDKMKEKENFIGSLANRAQADNKKEAESTDGEDPNLDELQTERSWFHTKE